MIVSNSATTALMLLTSNNPQNTVAAKSANFHAPHSIKPTSTQAAVHPFQQQSSLTEFTERFSAWVKGLEDGSISPETKSPSFHTNGSSAASNHDNRKVPTGSFVAVKAPSEGGELIIKDAAHPDRKSAVMNAYHFGMALMEHSQNVVRLEEGIARKSTLEDAFRQQVETGEGTFHDPEKGLKWLSAGTSVEGMLSEAKLEMERASTSLGKMFSFTANALTTAADGSSEFTGFTISHGEYGKIMEVSADGEVTMFDANGKEYSREEYVTNKPDGLIGEMHNDLVDEADQAQMQQTINQLKQGRSSMLFDMSDPTKFDLRV